MAEPPGDPAGPGVGEDVVRKVLAAAAPGAAAVAATAPLARGRALLSVAVDLESRRAELVDLVRRTERCRLSEALAAVDYCIDTAVRWAGWADKLDLLVPRLPGSVPPSVVGVLGGGRLLPTVRTTLAVLAAGGSCVLTGGGVLERLADAVVAELGDGAAAALPQDPATTALLAGGVEVLDARWAGAEFTAAVRRAAAAAGTRVLRPVEAGPPSDAGLLGPLLRDVSLTG
ncbi:aldehyde dehydrogenase family protein [Kineococcus auxinigenes]|uniref:aldehyde dehydrogenase family protein n=1 Tax=unclassified Kineococcus TaxID=2621656 RepID=UPI003D7DA4DE